MSAIENPCTIVNHADIYIGRAPADVWRSIVDDYVNGSKFRFQGYVIEPLHEPWVELGSYRMRLDSDGTLTDERICYVTERDDHAMRLSMMARYLLVPGGLTVYATYVAVRDGTGTRFEIDSHSHFGEMPAEENSCADLRQACLSLQARMHDGLQSYLGEFKQRLEDRTPIRAETPEARPPAFSPQGKAPVQAGKASVTIVNHCEITIHQTPAQVWREVVDGIGRGRQFADLGYEINAPRGLAASFLGGYHMRGTAGGQEHAADCRLTELDQTRFRMSLEAQFFTDGAAGMLSCATYQVLPEGATSRYVVHTHSTVEIDISGDSQQAIEAVNAQRDQWSKGMDAALGLLKAKVERLGSSVTSG